jgi:hypothetical protein
VESRLLPALVGLTGRHSISVSAFPQAAEEAAAGAPARTVVIDGIDGAPVVARSPAVQDATAFLAARVGPHRPSPAEVGCLDGHTELTVGYPVAGPACRPPGTDPTDRATDRAPCLRRTTCPQPSDP